MPPDRSAMSAGCRRLPVIAHARFDNPTRNIGNGTPACMIPIPTDNRILYFARDRAQFGFLSHFHPSPMLLDGELWPTVEHFYQAQKSPDPHYRAAIREAIHPGRAKSLAAQPMAPRRISRHSWFKAHDRMPRRDFARGQARHHASRRPSQVRAERQPARPAARHRQRRAGRGLPPPSPSGASARTATARTGPDAFSWK